MGRGAPLWARSARCRPSSCSAGARRLGRVRSRFHRGAALWGDRSRRGRRRAQARQQARRRPEALERRRRRSSLRSRLRLAVVRTVFDGGLDADARPGHGERREAARHETGACARLGPSRHRDGRDLAGARREPQEQADRGDSEDAAAPGHPARPRNPRPRRPGRELRSRRAPRDGLGHERRVPSDAHRTRRKADRRGQQAPRRALRLGPRGVP